MSAGDEPGQTSATVTVDERPRRTQTAVPEGAAIGRYRVQGELGRGGMGVVYRAEDPLLGRWVALKVWESSRSAEDAVIAGARLVREAHALARLSHPNVVNVFDVGVDAGRVYVAMEMVSGVSLTAWAKQRTRSTIELLDVAIAAGRGIAAAHAAGLVHRDIKPANILVGTDGRARVLDFGLARAAGDLVQSDEETPSSPPSSDLHVPLTHDGAIAGTAGYVAPELYRHESAEAASDQFAYAVTVFALLHGRKPFAGATWNEVRDVVLSGEVSPGPRRDVPARLDEVVRRGMARDPDDRFPDVTAMVDALEGVARKLRGRRLRLWLAAAALAIAGTAVLTTVFLLSRAAREGGPAACRPARAALEAVWNDRARDELATRLGADRARHAIGAVDRWVGEWRLVADGACGAEAARPAERDQRLTCLGSRTAELSRQLELESAPDALVEALHRLTPPSTCDSPGGDLRALQPATQAQEDEARAIRAALDDAVALGRTGAYARAAARADPLLERARKVGFPPLTLEVLTGVVELRRDAHRLGEHDALVDEAIALAADLGHEAAALRLWTVWLDVKLKVGDVQRADAIAVAARAAAARVPDRVARARLDGLLARLAYEHGALDQAVSLCNLALEGARGTIGEELLAGDLLSTLGNIHLRRGDFDAADEAYGQAQRTIASAVGPEHPRNAMLVHNRALVLQGRGDLDGAREQLEHALATAERAYGDRGLELAAHLYSLGNLETSAGNMDRAFGLVDRAIALVRAGAPESPKLGAYIGVRGIATAIHLGCDPALPLLRESVERLRATAPQWIAPSMRALGQCLEETAPDEAEAMYLHVLARSEHLPAVGVAVRIGLAKIYWRRGTRAQRERARALVTEARTIAASAPGQVPTSEFDAWEAIVAGRAE